MVRCLFALIVIAEVAAVTLLWFGVLGLIGAFLSLWAEPLPLLLAQLGALTFTLLWAGFITGGQWFYYWHGEFGQTTHLLAMLWGILTLIVLMLPG